jgi:mutator protein MutT
MKTEYSAGGIIIRKFRTSWQVLLIRDMNSVWTFPKGKIETGETPRRAAVREIAEEVGLTDLSYRKKLQTIHYTYKRNGIIEKTVEYFLFEYSGKERPVCQKEEGISEAKWVSINSAKSLVGYPETNAMLLQSL